MSFSVFELLCWIFSIEKNFTSITTIVPKLPGENKGLLQENFLQKKAKKFEKGKETGKCSKRSW